MTIKQPDFSTRAIKTSFRKAVDGAFDDYRENALPKHFKRSAVSRYGGEYKKLAQGLRNEPGKNPLVGRTAPFRLPGKRTRTLSPSETPGRSRHAAVKGNAAKRGPARLRRLVLTALPRYFYKNPPGSANKVDALEQTNRQDENDFAKSVEKRLKIQ